MRQFSQYGQFAEILIQCYDDTLLLAGNGQDLFISWINRPFSRPNHIISGRLQTFVRGLGNAGV
jgi:hypothetical protein